MSKVKVALQRVNGVTLEQARPGLDKELIGYQEINCHIIFDVRMEFQLKERFVAGDHRTEAINIITYSSVVSHESVCIGFLLEYLCGVDITDIDLENAYLNAPCAEKIWFVGGDECRENKVRF